MAIDRALPCKKLFDGQRITAARIVEAQQSAAHGSNDFGLAADHPTLRSRRRKVGESQRAAVRPNDVAHASLTVISHCHLVFNSITHAQSNRSAFNKRPKHRVKRLCTFSISL